MTQRNGAPGERRARGRTVPYVEGQCEGEGGCAGSVIPHAGAMRPLMIPMIETPFRTAAVAGSRLVDCAMTRGDATGWRAVRLAAVTRDTDREDPVTAPAGLLTKGCVQRRWSSGGPLQLDVPPNPWHNRQDSLGVLEPEAVTRVRRISPGPHRQSVQPTPSPSPTPTEKRRGRCGNPHRTRLPTPPTAHVFSQQKKQEKNQRRERRGEHRPDFRALT